MFDLMNNSVALPANWFQIVDLMGPAMRTIFTMMNLQGPARATACTEPIVSLQRHSTVQQVNAVDERLQSHPLHTP